MTLTDKELADIARQCDCPTCRAYLVTEESGVLYWKDKEKDND